MVSIIPAERTPWDVIGKKIGANISENLPGAVEQGYNRGMLQQSLAKIRDIAKDPNATPLDAVLATMEAGAGIPGSERYLGMLAPEIMKLATAKVAPKTPLASELEGGEEMPQMGQRQQLPSFMGQQREAQKATEFFPTNVGPKEQVGNVAQEATTGVKMPLLTPNEYGQRARQLAAERTEQGIPTTPLQAMEEIKQHEEDKKIHNAKVDEELEQRVTGQEKYGNRAVESLNKVLPGSPPEVQAYFKKLGENVSREGKSEAEIDRFLAEKAKNFANSVSNIKSDISAPRIHKNLVRGFLGTYKNFDQAAADARKHLKPLLDAQLYDYSRNLLAEQGYYPEEREIIVNPLTEKSQALLNAVPAQPKPYRIGGMAGTPVKLDANAGDKNEIKTALLELKRIEPNFSLPLARKTFEDKHYGWRTFKDALNDLQEEGFTLEDDQRTQMGILDSPPLTELERILEGLNLQGR